jgi:hypothetical protein
MSWRRWMFPTSPGARAEKIIGKAKERVAELRKPYADLALAVVSAAWEMSQSTKPWFRPVGDFAKSGLQEVHTFYDFLAFLMHLTNRLALNRLGPNGRERLATELRGDVVPVALDTFFAHWPETLKSGIRRDFLHRVQSMEIEYGQCKHLDPEKTLIDEYALASHLAVQILQIAGYDDQPEHLSDDSARLVSFINNLVRRNLNSEPLINLGAMVEHAGDAIAVIDLELKRTRAE